MTLLETMIPLIVSLKTSHVLRSPIKGAKGSLTLPLTGGVAVEQADKKLNVQYQGLGVMRVQAGATRAHLANMVTGVTAGFKKDLQIEGVANAVTTNIATTSYASGNAGAITVHAGSLSIDGAGSNLGFTGIESSSNASGACRAPRA